MKRFKKRVAAVVLVIGAIFGSLVVTQQPAAAVNSWQYAAKCVFWPAGVGNWAAQPYWKIKWGTDYYSPYFVADAAQNRSNYTWISGPGASGLGNIRRNGYGTWDRYNGWPAYYGTINYGSLYHDDPEPVYYETSRPYDNDLAYTNRGLFGNENSRQIVFSNNVLNCNSSNGSGIWYGSW